MAESNKTSYNERIYIEVVHLGIGFVVRPKLGPYDLVKNEKFQHNLEFTISATELHNCVAESNETFYNERIYIEVMHLGIGFFVRPKLGSYDLVKNEEFQHNLEFAIPRPNSTTTGQNRIELSTMKECILKLCTGVLVSSCDRNWGKI